MSTPKTHSIARLWLCLWIAQSSILGSIAYINPVGFLPSLSGWDTQSSIQLIELGLLLLIAKAMHITDRIYETKGFVHFYRKLDINSPKYAHSDNVLRGLLTVLSIRSALTLGCLVVLLSHRKELLSDQLVTIESFLHTPPITLFALAVTGLSGSALITLAAIQSYDYALRFTWDSKPNEMLEVKMEFIRKAHSLGVIGFYCLVWSLIAAAGLVGALEGLVVTTSVFLVFWYYYYFKFDVTNPTPAEQAVKDLKEGASGTPVSCLKLAVVTKDGSVVQLTLKEQWPAVREWLNVLQSLLPNWAKSPVQATIDIGEKLAARE